jgi:hypothetical protein
MRKLRWGAAAAALALGLVGCGAGSGQQPLISLELPGDITCVPMNAATDIGMASWRTNVAFTTVWYVDKGAAPATIRSISLVDPHGLVLHRAIIYEMVGAWYVLNQVIAWSELDKGALPSAWRRRQPIPGAVIPTGHTHGLPDHMSRKDNLYVVAEDVTATSPNGGWAAGEKLSYTSGRHVYSITAQTGIGLGSALIPLRQSCDAQVAAMKAVFHGNDPFIDS